MADLASGLIRQGATFGLNQMLPALFSLGPITLGLGTVIGLFMSLMGKDVPNILLVDDIGKAVAGDDGQLITAGQYGPYASWVANLFVSYAKLTKFFTDRDLDVNDLSLSIEFKAWSKGQREVIIDSDYAGGHLDFGGLGTVTYQN